MSKVRQHMPEQQPAERRNNFKEVALGYTNELALQEASRCLGCKAAPCRKGCPVEVNIPEFIRHIKENNLPQALITLKDKNSLPAICGRVCPQEDQCEKHCVLRHKSEPVAIGRLERYVADNVGSMNIAASTSTNSEKFGKIAIIGAGPAGLAAAGDLARKNYDVTIFEALHAPGGVLIYGIPEFRLPKDVVKAEIKNLEDLGVKIIVNAIIGKTFTIDELMSEEKFDSVFISTGAGLPNFMNIAGENLNGVYSANEFLTRVNLMKAYQPSSKTPVHKGDKVAVVGAGNVAMDAARTALRLGASEVHIVYRRSVDEIPARAEEFEHAKEEGIIFDLLTNPIGIHGNKDGWVEGLECIKMELGEPDTSGRRKPIPVKGSNFTIAVDTVIMAIGQGPNPLIQQTTKGLKVNKWGNIVADEDGHTTREGIFAGGDIVTGAATVILAMGAGKKAATSIHTYMTKKNQGHTCWPNLD